MFNLLLVPALIMAAPSSGLSEAMEVRPRTFVLHGPMTLAIVEAMKAAKITHVINLREDGEPGFDATEECAWLSETNISYCRVALGRVPSKDDFDLFRMVRRDMPSNARVLIHCADGNRAAAVTCAWMILDAHLDPEEAIALAKQAGLARPETEKALRKYLSQAKA